MFRHYFHVNENRNILKRSIKNEKKLIIAAK